MLVGTIPSDYFRSYRSLLGQLRVENANGVHMARLFGSKELSDLEE